HNTRIVTSFSLGFSFVSFAIYGVLFLHNGSNRFKGYFKVNIFAITYSTLNSAAVVCFSASICFKNIIMFASFHFSASKTTSVFKTFYGIYGKHRFAQFGVELVKNRLA